MTNYNDISHDLEIHKAAIRDDWDCGSRIFRNDPSLMTKRITRFWDTPLHISIGTNHSDRFVEKLVEDIVRFSGRGKLFEENVFGNNPLHFAAIVGNTTATKLLVKKYPDMTLVPNRDGNMPLQLAAWHGNKETLKYLLEATPVEERNSPYTGVAGGDLITLVIKHGFNDVALNIIRDHSHIVFQSNGNDQTALEILAQKPENFASGRRLGFWGRLIYSLIPMKKNVVQVKPMKKNEGARDEDTFLPRIFSKLIAGFWSATGYVAPTVRSIHDIKVNDNLSNLLVKRICKIVIERNDHSEAWAILGSAIVTAVKYGAYELIEECILTYPGIISYDGGNFRLSSVKDMPPHEDKFNLFREAIKHRQERVYNLVYQMSSHKVFATTLHDNRNENVLHMAARLAPPHRLVVLTGAALQMQRELQWFQEVHKLIAQLSYEKDTNTDEKTPRMIFTDEHKELLVEGKQWMKNTASSCTVVAALIITMAFAAAFTLPGGIQNDGKPVLVKRKTFMLFVVSDAVALFSSTTSVLMCFGILTSGMAEDDFLYVLPKRLTIGLLSLFISLAATMIAFSSVLALMLQGEVTWIAAPLVVATSIPMYLFGLLEFPLLVELVKATYGRSIFHQQNARRIH